MKCEIGSIIVGVCNSHTWNVKNTAESYRCYYSLVQDLKGSRCNVVRKCSAVISIINTSHCTPHLLQVMLVIHKIQTSFCLYGGRGFRLCVLLGSFLLRGILWIEVWIICILDQNMHCTCQSTENLCEFKGYAALTLMILIITYRLKPSWFLGHLPLFLNSVSVLNYLILAWLYRCTIMLIHQLVPVWCFLTAMITEDKDILAIRVQEQFKIQFKELRAF